MQMHGFDNKSHKIRNKLKKEYWTIHNRQALIRYEEAQSEQSQQDWTDPQGISKIEVENKQSAKIWKSY